MSSSDVSSHILEDKDAESLTSNDLGSPLLAKTCELEVERANSFTLGLWYEYLPPVGARYSPQDF